MDLGKPVGKPAWVEAPAPVKPVEVPVMVPA